MTLRIFRIFSAELIQNLFSEVNYFYIFVISGSKPLLKYIILTFAKELIMKHVVSVFICVLPLLAIADNRTAEFTKDYSYRASPDDSRNSAREKAIKEAQALLLQQIGVLVEARQKAENTYKDTKAIENFTEEITTYTIGKVNTVPVGNTETWDGYTYSAKFRMTVDTSALFAYLDNIVKQKQQIINDSLAKIKKRIELEQEMERQRMANVAKTRADSTAKAKRISELELAVRTARNWLQQEQQSERPLRVEKEKKEHELSVAKRQVNEAENDYKKAANSSDATTPIGVKKTANAAGILQDSKDNCATIELQYNAANKEFQNAQRKVSIAQQRLQAAEDDLAKELKSKIQTTDKGRQDDTPEVNNSATHLKNPITFDSRGVTKEAKPGKSNKPDNNPYGLTEKEKRDRYMVRHITEEPHPLTEEPHPFVVKTAIKESKPIKQTPEPRYKDPKPVDANSRLKSVGRALSIIGVTGLVGGGIAYGKGSQGITTESGGYDSSIPRSYPLKYVGASTMGVSWTTLFVGGTVMLAYWSNTHQ